MKLCTIEDCEKKSWCKSLCSKHYSRLQRKGDPLHKSQHDKRPALIEGDIAKLALGIDAKLGYAIVDKEFAYLDKHNWSLGGRGYPMAYVNGKVRKLHHLVLGKPQDGYEIDHLNRNKLDARTANLKVVKHIENMQNVDWSKNYLNFKRNIN